MIAVVIIYAICWLPLHVITIAGDINRTFYNLPGMNIMWTASHWLAMSNCMYNPFIYCWMNAKYRNGFAKVFSCFTCGLLKSRDDIELQRMRRSQNNPTAVGSTFSHQYHRSASVTCDTEYSIVEGKNFVWIYRLLRTVKIPRSVSQNYTTYRRKSEVTAFLIGCLI